MRKEFCLVLSALLASTCLYGKAETTDKHFVSNAGIAQQQATLSGSVEDDFGAVTGATVAVKGTSNGTVSDLEGRFTLGHLNMGDVIQVSFIGYVTQEFVYSGQDFLQIKLLEDTQKLDEVVITALGMKRAQKALGYAMTELKGEALATGDINPVASLQGKVAGVEIAGSDGGMFGSTKIQIRGASTLSNNNQPIYVVDGVILDNATAGTSPDWEGHAQDFGNELKNLNPADFETVSVLKGAAATALYGSRGLNGAVVITTKNARKGQGLGINLTQALGVDHVFAQPDLQNVYGDGMMSGYVDYGQTDENGSYYRFDNAHQFKLNSRGEPMLNTKGMGFGPRFDGRAIEGYDYQPTTYKPVKNNYRDLYNLGFSTNTNLTIQGGNEKTTFYTSTSYLYRTGTLPNNSFERLNLLVKASHQIAPRVNLAASLTFANSSPRNPQRNIGELFANGTFAREYAPAYYRHKYKGAHGGMASASYGDTYGNVPGKGIWWSIYENEYTQKENNVRPALELNVDLLEWLKFRLEGNYNYYYIRNETKELGTGYANEGGYYKMGLYDKEQTNLYATFTLNKTVGDWTFNGFLRGEYYNNFVQEMTMNTEGGLVVPGQYFIENSKNQPAISGKISATKRMLSVAFQAGASWKNQVFVDITGRNDWSSSLVYTNRTGEYAYFYPSINGAWLLNETFEMPAWISLAKLRASWAQVGNDTDPYKINSAYTLKNTQQSDNYLYSLVIPETMYSPNLKPERKNAWEVGLDWRFLESRIQLDVAYYKANTYNQIMSIAVPYVSGVKNQLINAGNIQNQGVEIALNTIPFRNKDWEWSLDFTYTKDQTRIVSLHENVAEYILLEGDVAYGNFRIGSVAKVGADYGLLMSDSKPKIDPKSGLEIYNWSDTYRYGYAVRSGVAEEIGKTTPDFLGSAATGLRWKNLSARVALDARFGGYVASFNSRYGTAYGYTEASLRNSDAQYGGLTWTSKFDNKTYADGIVPKALIQGGTIITQPDGNKYTVAEGGESYQSLYERGLVEPMHASTWYYRRNSWGQGVINDDWYRELSYIALREISLSYRMPNAVAAKIGAGSLSLGLSARNLGYLYNTAPSHENPESIRGTKTAEFRLRSFQAFTANYLFTVNLGF
jgi:iron complex outermembrane receptor protein